MPIAFRRAQERYGDTAPPQTPYQRAAQVWDDRLGTPAAAAANWRLMAFVCAGLAAIALGAYIYERQNTHIRTYVVPIDRYGRPGRIELADKDYVPTKADNAAFVGDFVSLVRARSTDPVVVFDNWNKALRRTDGEARATLIAYQHANDAAARLGLLPVTVQIVSVLPRSAKTYQVQWQETAYDQGIAQPPRAWTGVFTVSTRAPADEAQLFSRPLGIVITSFQWSPES